MEVDGSDFLGYDCARDNRGMPGSGGLAVRGLIHYESKASILRRTRLLRPLEALRNQVSGYLSCGGHQMLVMGRGLVARPRPMLLDEASLDLAPSS